MGFELELDWVSLLCKRVKRVQRSNGLKGISYLMEWWVCDLGTRWVSLSVKDVKDIHMPVQLLALLPEVPGGRCVGTSVGSPVTYVYERG